MFCQIKFSDKMKIFTQKISGNTVGPHLQATVNKLRNLLYVKLQASSAFYPQWDGKRVET